MNRQDLVRLVKDGCDAGLSVAEAQQCVNIVLCGIGGALEEGHVVRLHCLGTLKVVQRPARTGRNPRTGEPLQIPARRTVQLKVSPMLHEALNQ